MLILLTSLSRDIEFNKMNSAKIKLLISLIFLLYSCQSKTTAKSDNIEKWDYINISFENITLKISNIDNTIEKSIVMSYKKSFKNSVTTYTPEIIKESIIKINSSDKDSIYKWSKKLVQHPIQPMAFCTDYVGKLFLDIEINEQVTQSCKYNSICEWSTLNTETIKLNILFKKVLN